MMETSKSDVFLRMLPCDLHLLFSARYDLSSLRILGTVGEPINPEAWQWYHEAVGQGRCPIVDTFWQTETVNKTKSKKTQALSYTE